jgi:oligoribonuclease NrnB/cAMP/cGMP phosphodiesterase (DHH superfamily)
MDKKILCIYHRDCVDGHAAAWVVGHACGFENVEFVSANYGDTPPDMVDREVYIVDFSYDPAKVPGDLLKQMARAKRLVMLDHHESSWEVWKDVPLLEHWTFRYEPSMSGVGVTWRWFFGPLKPMPMVLQHIQDRDLWNFNLPHTRELHAVAVSHGMLLMKPWEESWLGLQVRANWAELPPGILLAGEAILREQKNLIQTLIARARVVHCAGYEVPICAVPYELRSEAGFWLGAKYPFSITYDDIWSEGVRKYSVRSRKKGGMNVIPIAEAFGGGGHKNAAAFSQPVDEQILFWLPSWQQQLKLDLDDGPA